jgi:hypothetical protein
MSHRRTLLLALASAFALSCTDADSPSGPEPLDLLSAPGLAGLAPAGPTGAPGFHFTPPIAASPPDLSDVDATLLDLLEVEICRHALHGCIPVRRIRAVDPLPARLRLSDDGSYLALWNSRDDALDAEEGYRIRILASGGELGAVDVDLLAPGEEPATGPTPHVQLRDGATLPIGFVVSEGLGERGGAEGGVVELADGAVRLEIPEGALPGDVFLTAVPATDLPAGGPPVVPGTAWDFGPDGIVFTRPVVMTIAFDPAALPPGVDPAELRIHKLVDGGYIQQDAGRVDLVAGTVSAEVEGFSVFVVIQRDRQNPEDRDAPVIRAMQARDPATGTFGTEVTLDASASQVPLTFRMSVSDNATGLRFMDVRYVSATGRQVRFLCYQGGPPTTGSDTSGDWDCPAAFPRFAETGTWVPQIVYLYDGVNNLGIYVNRAAGFCDQQGRCVDDPAVIHVVGTPSDVTPPVVQSLSLSLDTQPRSFGPSVSVDAASGAQTVILGIAATDDLSGVGPGLIFDFFQSEIAAPSGQGQFSWTSCSLTQGTPLDGFWECTLTIPAQAESGSWRLRYLRVPDRAGNGGWSGFSDFRLNASGQLCKPEGNCLATPTVEVTSVGDNTPPALQEWSVVADGPAVTTRMRVADDLSGVTTVFISWRSTETTQFQDCGLARTEGTATDGVWECTITFPEFAARGQWVPTITLWDAAGNPRTYTRRESDGFLCYFDPPTGTSICSDFGDTDLVLL